MIRFRKLLEAWGNNKSESFSASWIQYEMILRVHESPKPKAKTANVYVCAISIFNAHRLKAMAAKQLHLINLELSPSTLQEEILRFLNYF